MMKSFTVEEINLLVDGELEGVGSHKITAPEQIEKAQKNHITFIGT